MSNTGEKGLQLYTFWLMFMGFSGVYWISQECMLNDVSSFPIWVEELAVLARKAVAKELQAIKLAVVGIWKHIVTATFLFVQTLVNFEDVNIYHVIFAYTFMHLCFLISWVVDLVASTIS